MKDQETYKPLLEALREAPVEMSMEDVDRMVVGFPLMPAPFDWTSIFSLKSIIMTSISALFIAGAFSLLSGEEKQGNLQVKQYQEETATEIPLETPEKASLDPNVQNTETSPLPAVSPEQDEPIVNTIPTQERQVNQAGPNAVEEPEEPVSTVNPVAEVAPPITEEPSINVTDFDRSFDLRDFNKVGLECSADVNIRQGSAFKVEAHGDEKLIEMLDIYVKNGQLTIDMKKERNNWNDCYNKGLTIEVTMPDLDVVNLAGSGDIHVDGFKTLDKLVLSVAGSGSIHGNDDVTIGSSLDVSIAGSGEVIWSGSVKDLDLSIAGSGDFQGENLRTDNADISISGSGDVNLSCEGELNVSIAGSGDVTYSGNARVKESVLGSGDVKRR